MYLSAWMGWYRKDKQSFYSLSYSLQTKRLFYLKACQRPCENMDDTCGQSPGIPLSMACPGPEEKYPSFPHFLCRAECGFCDLIDESHTSEGKLIQTAKEIKILNFRIMLQRKIVL